MGFEGFTVGTGEVVVLFVVEPVLDAAGGLERVSSVSTDGLEDSIPVGAVAALRTVSRRGRDGPARSAGLLTGSSTNSLVIVANWSCSPFPAGSLEIRDASDWL